MSKGQRNAKEGKKEPVMNLKEKRVAKQQKKDNKDPLHQPFMPRT